MTEKKTSKEKGEKGAKSPYEIYTENQIKSAFEVFDEDRNGRAKVKHLGTILRALSRVVTSTDLRKIAEKVEDPEFPKYMRLEKLIPVATKLLLLDSFKSSSKENIIQAFATIDRERNGCIDADYLIRIFKEYGENIDEDVLEKLVNDADDSGSRQVNYNDFSDKLLVPPCFDIDENRRKIRLELSRENARTN